MNIKAYLKPHCDWSDGVRAILRKYGLVFEDYDISNYPDLYAEMVRKSGQPLAPCVEIDGVMLANVSGEEVENYLLAHHLSQPSPVAPEAPSASACPPEAEQTRFAGAPIRFF